MERGFFQTDYTGTAEIAEHNAQNSFLSVFHAADYLRTARAAASREKSKARLHKPGRLTFRNVQTYPCQISVLCAKRS